MHNNCYPILKGQEHYLCHLMPLTFFVSETGIKKYDIPKWIRTAKGLENTRIAEFNILHYHGFEKRSHITGRSVVEVCYHILWNKLLSTTHCNLSYDLHMGSESKSMLDLAMESLIKWVQTEFNNSFKPTLKVELLQVKFLT